MISFFEIIGWYPGIGDPTFLGWLTVFAYVLTACLSYLVANQGRKIFRHGATRMIGLWYAIALIFVLLAINKQLDLQTFMTSYAKYLSIQQGWYESRRIVQVLFIACVFVLASLTFCALLWFYRKDLKHNLIAFCGLVLLLAFIFFRASSINNIDIFINISLGPFKLNHIFELGGICLVGFNAFYLLTKVRENTVC